jgi:hypothetical protein
MIVKQISQFPEMMEPSTFRLKKFSNEPTDWSFGASPANTDVLANINKGNVRNFFINMPN